jgi:hypothetical protein
MNEHELALRVRAKILEVEEEANRLAEMIAGAPAMSEAALPLAQVQRIDAVCRRFEHAWKSAASTSQRPRIEDHLGDTPESERSALVQELIAQEIAYRRQAGETPRLEEYRAQFPALDTAAFATASSMPGATLLRAACPCRRCAHGCCRSASYCLRNQGPLEVTRPVLRQRSGPQHTRRAARWVRRNWCSHSVARFGFGRGFLRREVLAGGSCPGPPKRKPAESLRRTTHDPRACDRGVARRSWRFSWTPGQISKRTR